MPHPFEDPQELIERVEAWPWTPAKWAEGTRAQHRYVMSFWPEVAEADFNAFARLVRAEGYKGKWGPSPRNGRSYASIYYEAGSWTYWWFPRCFNREHRSVDTLRRPVSRAEAEAQQRFELL